MAASLCVVCGLRRTTRPDHVCPVCSGRPDASPTGLDAALNDIIEVAWLTVAKEAVDRDLTKFAGKFPEQVRIDDAGRLRVRKES
jgi:hypothetical protein